MIPMCWIVLNLHFVHFNIALVVFRENLCVNFLNVLEGLEYIKFKFFLFWSYEGFVDML